MQPNAYDYLIVGAGLFGAVFAHEARRTGRRCLVVDKRPHRGGNLYCESIEGINVHKYGAHIFHTSDKSSSSTATPTRPWHGMETACTTCPST